MSNRNPNLSWQKQTSSWLDEMSLRFDIRQVIQARMLGVSVKTTSDLRCGKKKPSDQLQRRVNEVKRLIRALAEIVDEDAIADWLKAPNEALDELSPLEAIERGEVDRIWQLVYALRSGALD